MGFRVEGLRLRIEGSGFVETFGNYGLGFMVQGLGFRIQGLGFKVWV